MRPTDSERPLNLVPEGARLSDISAARERRMYGLFYGGVLGAWAVIAAVEIVLAPESVRWPNVILTLVGGWIITLAVNRPGHRRAIVAAVVLDVLSVAVPVYASAGFGAAIVFPLLGGLLLVPSTRGRALGGAFVAGWAVSVVGMTLSFVVGPMGRLGSLTYPPSTVATGAVLAALAYVTIWWVASRWHVALDEARAATSRALAGEASLRVSEARSRELIEDSGDGILVSDPAGRYVDVNPALCRMLGYTREQLLEMKAGELTAPDDPVGNEGMDRLIAEASADTGILVERRYRRSDGASLPVEVRFKVLPDGRQQRNVRDITERQRARQALEASETRLRTALDTMLDGVTIQSAVRDEHGRIVDFRIDYANSAIGAIGGTAGSLQAGRTLLELFPAHRTNGLFDAYVKVVETGTPFETGSFRIRGPGRGRRTTRPGARAPRGKARRRVRPRSTRCHGAPGGARARRGAHRPAQPGASNLEPGQPDTRSHDR